MGKKRKAPSADEVANDDSELHTARARMRVQNFEDVADSDDEFHINREKILLEEEPDAKRRRKWQEQEEFLQPSDEEVLAYSESAEEDDEDDHDFSNDHVQYAQYDGSDIEEEAGGDDDDDDGGWGLSKQDMYGADAIETEEQALEEEAEALRLQRKQLQSMSAADYGFDETEWQNGSTAEEKRGPAHNGAVVTEVLPQLQISEDATPTDLVKLLRARYPEFEHLRQELLNMGETKRALEARIGAAYERRLPTPKSLNTKLRAVAAYIGALSMYFALLTSPASSTQNGVLAMAATELRAHPLMDTLVKCKELWYKVKDMPVAEPDTSEVQDSEQQSMKHQGNDLVSADRPTKSKKSRAQRHADAARAAADAREAERLQRTEAGLADLDALIAPAMLRKSKRSDATSARAVDSPDTGEEAPLTAREMAEKSKAKKSLRFYTSQIAQKANKRGAAGRNAGGDDDIPYRERLKDRQARLIAEAERRGRKPAEAGEELGGDSDEEDRRQAVELRNGPTGEVDYYNLVAARSANKKSAKAALAEARKEAALQGGQVVQAETIGADGKRKISYAIEKNKGLTPHRKKDVRNPRVKKRKKFDEKKKKLASIKPVYKGGEGRGGYGGELTGIKTGLVKSTKL